jgi:hypothetical protein
MAFCRSAPVRSEPSANGEVAEVPHVTVDPNVIIATVAAMQRGLKLRREDTKGRLRSRSLVLRRTFDSVSYSPSRKDLAERSILLEDVTSLTMQPLPPVAADPTMGSDGGHAAAEPSATSSPSASDDGKHPLPVTTRPSRETNVRGDANGSVLAPSSQGSGRSGGPAVRHSMCIETATFRMVFVFDDYASAHAVTDSLAYLIRKRRTFHDEAAQRMAMIDLWMGAKLSSNGELGFAGLVKIAEKLGWTWSRQELRQWFNEMDGEGGSGGLDFDELCHFFDELTMRQQLAPLFIAYTETNDRLLMPPVRVAEFFHCAQGQPMSNAEAAALVKTHGIDPDFWSFSDFCQFLTSVKENSWLDPCHSNVHQDMAQPLHHYFIATSHNSCVTGSQTDGDVQLLGISGALRTGARVIDLAINDFEGHPHVWRPYTFSTPLPVREVFEAIRDNAFHASDFPVIVTIEMHGGTTCADMLADVIRDTIGHLVHTIRPGILKTLSATTHLYHTTFGDSDDLAAAASAPDFGMESAGSDVYDDAVEQPFAVSDADEEAMAALGRALAAARKSRRALHRIGEHATVTQNCDRAARRVLDDGGVAREIEQERLDAIAVRERARQDRRERIAKGLPRQRAARVPMVTAKLFETAASAAFRQAEVHRKRAELHLADAEVAFEKVLKFAESALAVAKATNAVHGKTGEQFTAKPVPAADIMPVLPECIVTARRDAAAAEDLPKSSKAGDRQMLIESDAELEAHARNAIRLAAETEAIAGYVRALAERANILREFAEEAAAAARVTPGSLRRKILLAYKCHAPSEDFYRPSDVSLYFRRNRERFAAADAKSSDLCHLVSFTTVGSQGDWRLVSAERLRAVPEAICVIPSTKAVDATSSRQRAKLVTESRDAALFFCFPESDASENMSPFHAFSLGVSMFGMNYQTFDEPMRHYDQFFRLNGRCGYVLKPTYLRVRGVLPGNQPFRYTVRVLMGTQLPGPEIDRKNHNTRWKVIVSLDSPPDIHTSEGHSEYATSAQTSERSMPYWNEGFQFDVCNVALSMLTLRVVDEEPDFNNEVAEAAIPLAGLRMGYRAVPLVSSVTGDRLPSASLLVHTTASRTTKVTEVRTERKVGLQIRRKSIIL